jgi:hypothetical protein
MNSNARRQGVTVVAVCVAAALVVGLVWWFARDDRPRAEAGEEVAAADGTGVSGFTSDLRLPSGAYEVTVGEAREELPDGCCADDPAATRAPEDGSFVGVEVSSDDDVRLGDPVAVPGAELPAPTFTLLVDTGDGGAPKEYPVASINDGWSTRSPLDIDLRTYVALGQVPDVDDLAVRVDYDGVAQVITPDRAAVDSGDAAALYVPDRAAPTPQSCGSVVPPAGTYVAQPRPRCTYTTRDVPYVAGLGWAENGTEWRVVSTGVDRYVSVDRIGGPSDYRYRASSSAAEPVISVSMDSYVPVKTWSNGDAAIVSVFPAPRRDSAPVTWAAYDLESPDDPRPLDSVILLWRRAAA